MKRPSLYTRLDSRFSKISTFIKEIKLKKGRKIFLTYYFVIGKPLILTPPQDSFIQIQNQIANPLDLKNTILWTPHCKIHY